MTIAPPPAHAGSAAAPTREASVAAGVAARTRRPLEALGDVDLARPRDPVGLLLAQGATRVPELVPVRHGRMLVSPFTFYRGAALPMADDLASVPSSGLRVQLCGDAHLSNFGIFGSPERRLVFDLNDFDETLPGPFEWDVARLVTSVVVAARENDIGPKKRRSIALATVAAYRETMAGFADQPFLAVWYARLDVDETLERFRAAAKQVGKQTGKQDGKQAGKKTAKKTAMQDGAATGGPAPGARELTTGISKARRRDGMQALGKLTTVVDGERRILSDPPLVVPIEQLTDLDPDARQAALRALFDGYASTLAPERRHLVEQYTLTQVARKVVGVGSVGTQAWILLLEPHDGLEPLILQAKEAVRSVLADYAGDSEYANQGERVVQGQRLVQAVGDVLLGWHRTDGSGGQGAADYYVRQLRDWKYGIEPGTLSLDGLTAYARLCAWTLARAHARTGDRIAVAAYLGDGPAADEAFADLAEVYADVTERDHAALAAAVASGRAAAVSEA